MKSWRDTLVKELVFCVVFAISAIFYWDGLSDINAQTKIQVDSAVNFRLIAPPTESECIKDSPRPVLKRRTIHLITHSHTDAGWIETFEVYLKNRMVPMFETGLPHIEEHKNDYQGKFSFANADFIKAVWERSPHLKQPTIDLVKSGNIELINDGVVMPDSACSYFDDLINNYEYGREWINKKFGKLSKIAWAIDIFGSSTGFYRLLSEMGFDSVTATRMRKKTAMDLVERGGLFANKMHLYPEFNMASYYLVRHFNTPAYEGLTQYCNHQILHPDFCGLELSYKFHKLLVEISDAYGHTNVMVPFGDDFAFVDYKEDWKKNSRIVNIFMSNARDVYTLIDLKFSSIGEYF